MESHVTRKYQHYKNLLSISVTIGLLLALQGCAAFLNFPQNVPALNGGFRDFHGEQYRTLQWEEFVQMPSFGDISLKFPPGMSAAKREPAAYPLTILYKKNRFAGLMGTSHRQLHVIEVPDGKTLRVPIPKMDGYHPKDIIIWVAETDDEGNPNDMRVLFRFAETEIIDPNDPDRHAAFWMDHEDQCFARGRIQTLEYTLDKNANYKGDRHPLAFESTLGGLCIFNNTSSSIVATEIPGWHLRSNVRVKIPKVYQRDWHRSIWQPYP